ncbi:MULTISPECIES: hypothetical protein [unclassified Rhizobium]|uniref:hypothetical protein n=1 Tax=unclassified Rhizobium TaxID=2613769 RepID=UPI00160C7618|nr:MULTISPECIES: hypothetical protein [unclassified Rhizobium]MBB3290643.1 hypothetical protein [Rhizobium sp. BK252]MBB3405423.1 hypothetical protein [Rhizobium sp. BK289]MBB3418074.1 hypothetical protein [Rhizobium sp. BK284]MBB3485849.1 hypothetical protein [Rhizobium sp. BK347]
MIRCAFRLHGTLPQFLRPSGFLLGQLLDQIAKKLRIAPLLIEQLFKFRHAFLYQRSFCHATHSSKFLLWSSLPLQAVKDQLNVVTEVLPHE